MTARAATPGSLLVVEDDRDLRDVFSDTLRLEGYDVLEAVDGLDALGQLRRGVRPALVLLDLVMPRMDGRELLGAMRGDAALAAIPVVLVTGTPPRDLRDEVRAILKKPVGIDDLLACVRAYADACGAIRSAGAARS
jgi:CheY-like chemotaxis protein